MARMLCIKDLGVSLLHVYCVSGCAVRLEGCAVRSVIEKIVTISAVPGLSSVPSGSSAINSHSVYLSALKSPYIGPF